MCDPPAKPAKTVLVESTPVQNSESVNLLFSRIIFFVILPQRFFGTKGLTEGFRSFLHSFQ
ncbi:hypothetical protein Hanom_Chr02g00107351 [Helianthus anomalus]